MYLVPTGNSTPLPLPPDLCNTVYQERRRRVGLLAHSDSAAVASCSPRPARHREGTVTDGELAQWATASMLCTERKGERKGVNHSRPIEAGCNAMSAWLRLLRLLRSTVSILRE